MKNPFKIVKTYTILRVRKLYKLSADNIWFPLIILSWWLANLLVPRRKVQIDDLNFTLSCTNWITHYRWYRFKTKEPETIYFLDNFLKERDIFFDIGANVGVFTIYAAKRYKNIQIYSFEPEISNLAALKDNTIENNIANKVIIYGLGISNSVGLSKLHLQDLTTGSALHTEDNNNIELSATGNRPIVWTEGIYTVSLDYFCKQLNVMPNVIKIDTDGNEYKILEGALNVLKNPMLRAIIIEMQKVQREYCYPVLMESGFRQVEYSFNKSENEYWIKN